MNVVRVAAMADLDAVASLEWKIFERSAWSPQSVEQEFDGLGESRHIAVVTESSRVVGYAILLFIGDVADVQRVAVDPAHRRRGWGALLLDDLLEFARGAGIARVMLEVEVDNAAAAGLYRRFGFEEISRRAGYYPDGGHAVVMALDLEVGDAQAAAEPRQASTDERGPAQDGEAADD